MKPNKSRTFFQFVDGNYNWSSSLKSNLSNQNDCQFLSVNELITSALAKCDVFVRLRAVLPSQYSVRWLKIDNLTLNVK